MSAELLPCPWCIGLYVKKVGRCIECTSCGASGPEMSRDACHDEYVRVWNTRATQPPQPSGSEGSAVGRTCSECFQGEIQNFDGTFRTCEHCGGTMRIAAAPQPTTKKG